MPIQNIFHQLLVFAKLYQHAKNEVVSCICSGEIYDLKILQSESLRAFWLISQNKPNNPIPIKRPYTYEQTLFHRTHPANRGPTSTTAVDWHLKVKDIRYDVALTKNYCIKVCMQKISSIHKVILKIEQILGSDELNINTHFWPQPPKNHWINF